MERTGSSGRFEGEKSGKEEKSEGKDTTREGKKKKLSAPDF